MILSQLLDGIATPPFDREIAGIACDSRQVEPGFAFVCIDGVAVDGHRFAGDALQSGAVALITQRDLGLPHQIVVENTRKAWAEMAANWFGNPAKRLHMIGVTGTNGKTSITYMLKHILEEGGCQVGLIGTIQTLVGSHPLPAVHTTPEAYELQGLLAQMVDAGCTHVVMEVSSHALAQNRVETIAFDRGIFTNLTQDHLDYHRTMENYCAAKKKLFENSKLSILNLDDAWEPRIAEGLSCPIVTYSVGNDRADYAAHNVREKPDGVDFELVGTGQIGRVKLSIPGLFSVYNALGAAACALSLGLPFETVVEALCTMRGVKGRAETVPTGRGFTVVIDYAHTPDGLEKICQALRVGCKGRLVTLFGCGGDRDRAKRPMMGKIAAELSDFLVITSDNPRSEDPMAIIEDILPGIPKGTPYAVIPYRRDAIAYAIAHAQPEDVILLAGKGHETYEVLKTGIYHLDEREVVAETLGLRNKWELGQP